MKPRNSANQIVLLPLEVVWSYRDKGVSAAGLVEDIRRNGLHRALDVSRNRGRWRLREGHHRLSAIKALGWTEVPVEMSRMDAQWGRTNGFTVTDE